MTKELTCVVCPAGCKISVTLDDTGAVTSVTGHTCARGKTYAESEITHPVRTLTTTVIVTGAANGTHMLPVKTNKPISRDLLFDAMRQLEGYTVSVPVSVGDVLIHDFMESGIDLVACKTLV